MSIKEKSGNSRSKPFNPLALHGHIAYLEIPALFAQFFHNVFNWTIRQIEPTRAAFDDSAGNLIGRLVSHLLPSTTPGLLPYIYTTNIHETITLITQHGDHIIKSISPEGDLLIATFRDSAGNHLGIWQFVVQ